jgi:sugar phosphate isomerase/epimerase
LTIALSVNSYEYPERFSLAANNGFALEYTPDPLKPELVATQVTPYLRDGVPIRFHCRFSQYELGNADRGQAIHALAVHQCIFDAISGLGEPFVTVHLNLDKRIPFDAGQGVENLGALVAYGRQRGLTVCLENLRKGPSSNPANVLAWARSAGASITLDIGHAVSADVIRDGNQTVPGFIDRFRERLAEAHIYGKEEDRHYPIEEIDSYKPVIDRLLETNCSWWTIELDSLEEALDTRMKLIDYLTTRHVVSTNSKGEGYKGL